MQHFTLPRVQQIKEGVGPGEKNLRHEVALVQAMLLGNSRPTEFAPPGTGYLLRITGEFDGATRQALLQFQSDWVFVDTRRQMNLESNRRMRGSNWLGFERPANMTPVRAERSHSRMYDDEELRANYETSSLKAGVVHYLDRTWRMLEAGLPREYDELLRILPDSATPYLSSTTKERDHSIGQIGALGFEATFAQRLSSLVRQMFADHGIAMSVAGADGGPRSFAQQAAIPAGNTQAGLGESFHNYFRGADMGFRHLRLIVPDGQITRCLGYTLEPIDPDGNPQTGGVNEESLFFWQEYRYSQIQKAGLHPTTLAGDWGHVQLLQDNAVSMKRSLAHLLNKVGSMRWRYQAQQFQCNLGAGTTYYPVGTPRQIWDLQSPLSETDFNAWCAANPATAAALAGPGPAGAGSSTPPQPTLAQMRTALKAELLAADSRRIDWEPKP